jgi:hypothetical protein
MHSPALNKTLESILNLERNGYKQAYLFRRIAFIDLSKTSERIVIRILSIAR